MHQNNIDIEEFFRSRKNANCILDLEKSLLSSDESCVLSSIDTLQDLLSQIFHRNMLHISADKDPSEKKFKLWLMERYNDFVTHLLSYLSHEDEGIQEKSLDLLLVLVKLEGEKPLKNLQKGAWVFPKELFEKVISGLASEDIDQQYLIMKFQKYVDYDDVKMYLLKAVSSLLQKNERVTDIFLQNCFGLLSTVKFPKKFNSAEKPEENESSTLLSQNGMHSPFYLKKKLFSKLFSTTWIQFLKFPLSSSLLKKVLLVLQKRIIPYLQSPCLLTDFLTDCYNQGGIVSLLALNGLFFLIDKYNVEYPDFFPKLYSLFDRDIINGKFSSRFFHLADLFLSSTLLPSHIVAAFAKRLSRISLDSKTECILRIISFICNLLIRHPTLETLIHRTDSSELSEDPYDFDASDPAESRALESSLWEIKTLQNHVNPDVSRKAKLINHELPKMEFELFLEVEPSIDDVYQTERKRKFVGAPAAVRKSPKLHNWWML